MSKQTIDAISLIPLLIGTILMLATGSGLILAKYPFVAGIVCLIVYAFIEVKSRKIIVIKSNQRWKSQKKTKHKLKKSSATWNAQRISSATNQDSRTSVKHKSFEMANWLSV